MEILGLTVDVPVTDLAVSIDFYADLIGRDPDLRPAKEMAEWVLRRDPELAIRLVVADEVTSRLRVGLGVADVAVEHRRLSPLAEVATKPGVISTLELLDPDGHQVVLWQDLMRMRPTMSSEETMPGRLPSLSTPTTTQ